MVLEWPNPQDQWNVGGLQLQEQRNFETPIETNKIHNCSTSRLKRLLCALSTPLSAKKHNPHSRILEMHMTFPLPPRPLQQTEGTCRRFPRILGSDPPQSRPLSGPGLLRLNGPALAAPQHRSFQKALADRRARAGLPAASSRGCPLEPWQMEPWRNGTLANGTKGSHLRNLCLSFWATPFWLNLAGAGLSQGIPNVPQKGLHMRHKFWGPPLKAQTFCRPVAPCDRSHRIRQPAHPPPKTLSPPPPPLPTLSKKKNAGASFVPAAPRPGLDALHTLLALGFTPLPLGWWLAGVVLGRVFVGRALCTLRGCCLDQTWLRNSKKGHCTP